MGTNAFARMRRLPSVSIPLDFCASVIVLERADICGISWIVEEMRNVTFLGVPDFSSANVISLISVTWKNR